MRGLACFAAVVLAFASACSGGGGEGSVVDPSIDEFDVAPSVQTELDDAASNGGGAEGSYQYDEGAGTLTITINTTSFACGIETGVLEATVISISDTTLVLRFGNEEEDGNVVWTRQDMGVSEPTSALVGIWKTLEPELFLILSNDGGAQVFGADEMCDSNDDRERNGDNCLLMGIDGGSDIDIDGEFEDWNAINSSATLEDPAGDYEGSDEGADLKELQVAWSFDTLYVRMDVHAVPSEAFQSSQAPNGGVYRLTVRGDGGLSLSSRVAYSPENQSWYAIDSNSDIQIGVGHAGIEWSINVGSYLGEGFETIDLIMVEPMDCGAGNCETLDYMDCAWINVPQ